jgi:AcrR family transcriptional regulator
MPKVSEQHREARREQILDAARACILEQGLEAVSMETIIARSGLSTGAVYRYFKGKDDIIAASVVEATNNVGAVMVPILVDERPDSPTELISMLLSAWVSYSGSGVGAATDIDRMPVAIHGWSYAQNNPQIKAIVEENLQRFRDLSVPVVKRWQSEGVVAGDVDPEAIAQLLLSICLGFVAQRSLAGGADVEAHAAAIAGLSASQATQRDPSRSAR